MTAKNVRYAWRSIRKDPGFAVTCALILALGIGISTTVFSVVYGVLLRPLPYPDAVRLCMVWKTIPKKNLDRDWTSYPTYEDWKRQNQSFEDLASYLRPDGARALLTRSGEEEQVQTEKVSDNYFSVLNVPALVGRTFSSSEMGRSANLAVLSYGIWKRRFGSAPEIVGQTLEIDNAAYEVLGVMPPAFEFPEKDVDVWLPIATDSRWHAFQTIRIADAFGVVGRLKSGVSPEQAQADMAVVSHQLAQAHAATDADLGVRVVSLAQQIVSSHLRVTLWLSLGAMLLVVLIACSNVAGLFLARTFALRKTFAIRLALGAGRSDILQQVLAEALLFALVPAPPACCWRRWASKR